MPMFLKSIGFSVFYIGILEGFAEAVAGFGKGFFGKLSDSSGRRVPFVRWGYFLSSISKPMMALFSHPMWIFFSRALDRTGKGVRTGARDAMLSAETTPENKGRVFGFHRAFDTIGASIGPLMALIYLGYYPESYSTLFLLAFLPGLASVAMTFLIRKEAIKSPLTPFAKGGVEAIKSPISPFAKEGVKETIFHPFGFLKYWKASGSNYRRLVGGLLAFALVNSSDIFLLLMAKTALNDDKLVILVYVFYNLVYALLSHPLGILADKIGLKLTYACGLVIFSGVYLAVAYTQNTIALFIIFMFYGVYAAATEGISKAWITNITPASDCATAIGFYTGWLSLATLLASIAAGLLWTAVSPQAPFVISSIVSLCVASYILLMFRSSKY